MSRANAINDRGQVAGTAGSGAQQDLSAFLYRPRADREDALEVLSGPTIPHSRGFGINAVADVVGDSVFPAFGRLDSPSHAALFRNDRVLDLGALRAGDFSRANDINASGLIVGFSGPKQDMEASRAFIWSPGRGMLDIGTLGGPHAQAYAINDAGFVTGTARTSDGGVATGPTHAFIYQPLSITGLATKRMVDLGTLGGVDSYGMDVNSANHVAGYSRINTTDQRVHAFLHDGTQMRDLGSFAIPGSRLVLPLSDVSVALGINDVDHVVGWSYLPVIQPPGERPIDAPQPAAFLYSQGVMRNLNDLLGPASANYWLYVATDINNSGQIVATALDRRVNEIHAVLLIPQTDLATAASGL